VFYEDVKIFWCKRCGSWRRAFEGKWRVPLEQASFVMSGGSMKPSAPSLEDEVPTRPDIMRRGSTLPGMPAMRSPPPVTETSTSETSPDPNNKPEDPVTRR
jgi:hypothetical protein